MAYRGLFVCLLLQEFRSQSFKRGGHVGMLEYVILFESKHQNGSHISFGYLSVLARFAPVGGPKLGRSEFLEPLMNLVLWQEKCNAFPSDHFLMLAAERGGLQRISSNSC